MKYLLKNLNVPAFCSLTGVINLLYGVGLPSESVEWSVIIYVLHRPISITVQNNCFVHEITDFILPRLRTSIFFLLMVISSNKLGTTVHLGNLYPVNLISQSVRYELSLR